MTISKPTRARQQGFTLLEMLTAITIFAMVSLSAWQILQGTMSARDVSADHNEQMRTLEYAMLVMEQDFQHYIDRGVRQEGVVSTRSLFAGKDMLDSDDEAIAFIRTGYRNPEQRLPRSELQPVRYRLKDGVLERQYFHVLDPEEESEPVTQNLLTDISSLKFEYFIRGRWVNRLRSTHPEALKIILEHEQFGTIERSYLLAQTWEAEEEA